MSAEDDFLTGSGVKSASFLTKGTTYEGYICEPPKLAQQLDFDTREPKTWPNGDKMMHLVVTLQTDEIDPELEEDDGRRRLYISYKKREAVAAALKKAGEKRLEVGGKLKIQWHDSEPKKGSKPGAKLFRAKYTPPDGTFVVDAGEQEAYLGDDFEDEPTEAPKKAPAKKAAARPARAAAPAEDDDLTEEDSF